MGRVTANADHVGIAGTTRCSPYQLMDHASLKSHQAVLTACFPIMVALNNVAAIGHILYRSIIVNVISVRTRLLVRSIAIATKRLLVEGNMRTRHACTHLHLYTNHMRTRTGRQPHQSDTLLAFRRNRASKGPYMWPDNTITYWYLTY